MKKLLFSLFIATLIVVGCKKEEITLLDISDFAVHVGGQGQNTAGNIAIDDYVTFVDLSRNSTEHSWTISNGSAFISDKFSDADSVYTNFIVTGNTSSDQKVNVLFQEAGLQPIQIKNTFDQEPTAGPATAIQQGGMWVIDTTYMIDVFDNLQPAFKVFKGTEEVLSVSASDIPDLNNSATWPVVEVEAGQTLTFMDLTAIGRPNKRAWTFEGSVPTSSGAAEATVSYFSLGTFTGGGFRSIRDGELPGQESAKVVPITVNVVPSTLPFLYDANMSEDVNELITFNVGGEVAPFTGLAGSFTVNVVNTKAGYNENIPVQSAKVSDNDATQIELVLSAPIYNSDVITVSYAGGGIKSADFRTLSDFGPIALEMHFADNLTMGDFSSFEVGHANWKKAFCDGIWVGNSNGGAGAPHFSRTEEKAAVGIASMKLDLYNGVETKLLQGTNFGGFGITAGDYLMSMKIFLEPGNILTTIETVAAPPGVTTIWDISEVTRGEWVEIFQTESFGGNLTKRYDIKVNTANNPASTDPQVLFFDDIQFKPLETR